MEEQPVQLSQGLPETTLPEPPADLAAALQAALAITDPTGRFDAIRNVVTESPTYLDAWARLSDCGRDDVERYAYARIGYHRGLDALRQSGWRGTGYVRWSTPSNRGFLRSLSRLQVAAEAIGETHEAERCDLFLRQLDPNWTTTDHD